jgi:pilus assembly protein CpaF
MGLAERLKQRPAASGASAASLGAEAAPEVFHDIKGELHRGIVDKLDLEVFDKLAPERRREELRTIQSAQVARGELPLNQVERERSGIHLLDVECEHALQMISSGYPLSLLII